MNLILKKSLGQNFLVDKKIINLIVELAKLSNNDRVIEVGPGDGALTEKILEKKPSSFTVIEKDNKLVSILEKRFENKINIINKDMINVNYNSIMKKDAIVFGNLPYNISTQILAKWIKMENLDKICKQLILMFQKEVADRIIATSNTKSYGRLSILSNWKMEIKKIIDIEPHSFKPSPKVRSTLLVFKPKKNIYKFKNPKNLEHITNIFFNQRRKMLKKPLKFLFKNFEEISNKLSIDLKSRPQNIDCLTYYKICELYEAQLTN